jgi:hypothetical protein
MNKYMRNLGLGIVLASSLYTGCAGFVAIKMAYKESEKKIDYYGEVCQKKFHIGPIVIRTSAYLPKEVKFGLKSPQSADTSGDALVSLDELKGYCIDKLAGKTTERKHVSQASQIPQDQYIPSSQKTIEQIVGQQPVPQNGVDVDEYFDRMISTQFADTSVLGLVKKMTPSQKFEVNRRLQTDAGIRSSMYASVSRMTPQQKAQIMVALIDISKDGMQVVKNLPDEDLLEGAYKINPNLRYEMGRMTPQQKAEVIKSSKDIAEKQMKENIKEMESLLSKLSSQKH